MHASHIDHILHNWEFDPHGVNARMLQGNDGRDVIQMRVDMGVLQLETGGRPDGTRPKGAETYYDYLLSRSMRSGPEFVLDEEQCAEVDREFVQFYHRRICWLQLREFALAVRDADHTLALMDFCCKHSPDEQWTMSHEQYRPFVLFHRTQAAALATSDAEAAINQINSGLEKMQDLFASLDAEYDFEDDEIVQRLIETREKLRERFAIDRTLREQLDDAVSCEHFELAAKLRDKLQQRRQT
ncbi:MAG: UvrB/UvrC motif-containing protein [Planctomycetes bacterium]|nr:UvrB/UvrC motif-containing protein [Planctomycetota bacterium]